MGYWDASKEECLGNLKQYADIRDSNDYTDRVDEVRYAKRYAELLMGELIDDMQADFRHDAEHIMDTRIELNKVNREIREVTRELRIQKDSLKGDLQQQLKSVAQRSDLDPYTVERILLKHRV